MIRIVSCLLAATALLAACDSKPAGKAPTPQHAARSEPHPAPQRTPALAAASDAADYNHTVVGVVTDVEDNGYPTFTFTVAPQGKPVIELAANVAELDLNGAPSALKGRTVILQYSDKPEPDLMDLRMNGHSVLGDEAPPALDPGWKQITGQLGGAGEVVGGDLPDTITVTAPDGTAVRFDYYISPSMVPADGKTVTAWYGQRTENRITAIKPQ